MRKTVTLSVLVLAGALLNLAFNVLARKAAGFPLYLDTILTVSLTLAGGLLWGLLTGLLTNAISFLFYFYSWWGFLFVICNMATAAVTWLFVRFFPRELSLPEGPPAEAAAALGAVPEAPVGAVAPEAPYKSPRLSSRRLAEIMNRMIVLILLSFCLCLVISVLGGVISACIQSANPALAGRPDPSGDLTATMFGRNIPLALAEILSRIPVNIVDRLITAFAGYGIALGLQRMLCRGA